MKEVPIETIAGVKKAVENGIPLLPIAKSYGLTLDDVLQIGGQLSVSQESPSEPLVAVSEA